MFAIIWIVSWAFVFGIFNDPSGWQIFGFIFVGLGGPIGTWISKKLKE